MHELPSFTAVFRSERVITRIHDLRLPVPLTTSQVVTFLILFGVAALVYAAAPLRGPNALLLLFGLPAVGAWALSRVRVDHRSPIAAMFALVGFLLRPRRSRRGARLPRSFRGRVEIPPW